MRADLVIIRIIAPENGSELAAKTTGAANAPRRNAEYSVFKERAAGAPSQGRPKSKRSGWYAAIMHHRTGGAARVQA